MLVLVNDQAASALDRVETQADQEYAHKAFRPAGGNVHLGGG
jgi:hypothetical protein